jgi:hypothetical protein
MLCFQIRNFKWRSGVYYTEHIAYIYVSLRDRRTSRLDCLERMHNLRDFFEIEKKSLINLMSKLSEYLRKLVLSESFTCTNSHNDHSVSQVSIGHSFNTILMENSQINCETALIIEALKILNIFCPDLSALKFEELTEFTNNLKLKRIYIDYLSEQKAARATLLVDIDTQLSCRRLYIFVFVSLTLCVLVSLGSYYFLKWDRNCK